VDKDPSTANFPAHDAQAARTRVVPTAARRRPVIAVLIHYIERTWGGYEHVLRRAFMAACREHDFDFVLVSGGALLATHPPERADNQTYQLVDASHFDGVVLVPTGLGIYTGIAGLLAELNHLSAMPMCSLGAIVPGLPSVVVDNGVGMAATVEHLISHHGRRNLAFLGAKGDHIDCQHRRNAFCAVTARHGLTVPAHRMMTCWLEPHSAEVATAELLARDPEIDAIVAVNDGSAMGALHALQRFGLGVPDRVSVTGYDDLPMARLLRPSLTSVFQPLAAMAAASIKIVAQQLAGQQPPEIIELPSSLVIRTSCGCPPEAHHVLAADEQLEVARQSYDERQKLQTMYGEVVSAARIFSLAVNRTELEKLVAEQLPRIHPPDCFIGIYSDDSRQFFRPLSPQRLALEGTLLRADASFLSELGDTSGPRAFLMTGFLMRDQFLGVVCFELGEEPYDYNAIRDQLGSAWQIVTLHEELVKQTTLTERSLQERQAAADRSQALSTLASGVAHDLNNALGALVSLSDVALDEVEEHRKSGKLLDSDTADDLRTIKSSALRATETIKDLMTLGRVRRTRQEPFDLSRLTRRVVAEHQELLTKTRVASVVLSLEANFEGLTILGSEPHVERAVGNILRNAVEAVSGSGRIDISVSMLNLDGPLNGQDSIRPGSYAVVSIADNGPGMDDEAIKRIFEPFFSTKRLGESSGSGLGLAIVHSVVQEHQGHINVSSERGRGSRFMLYFPRVDSQPQVRPSVVPAAGGTARILIVDDDLTQLRTAKRVLSRMGYDITTMSSGARTYELLAIEAKQTATEHLLATRRLSSSFDLLIIDMALNEDESGIELFSRIRLLFPEQKGILASGHAFIDHEEQICAANLLWLPKPYTVESIAAAIRTAMRVA
jgi:signal transduction histidine kinase/DNA-binding LacI/PurR family transcriptional regulator/ActR/RegA family two-component response regulator